ncbi:alpha/beta fold hydrolase [Aestuariivirga sp.]|uniref:alpha/beta fold hydrolase n=1 Tax=Aestuariivirga sp. TaxID=2650926 RepID=UPI003BAB3545
MASPIRSAFSVEGEGEPIFLIHGIGASRASFAGLVPFLKPEYRCISYDLRGHGASPKPEAPYTLDDLVEDLEALRKELGIEKAHFAGHSLGGMIGPAYARKYPQHVLTLGLYSTAAFRTADDSAKVKGVVAAMRTKGIPQVLETLKDRWFTPEFAERKPDVITRRMQQVIDTDPQVFLSVFDIYAETEMSPWLHEVSHPSLVLTGENDGGCNPRLNRLIADALPQSELVILPVLRHAILLEAADQVAPPVLDFLRRHRA